MADPQERMQEIASTFGESDIKIYIGRDKVYPDKSVSEAKMQQLENALKSPETEKSAIKVKEANKVIYHSIEGAVTADTKGIAAQFQEKPNYFDLLQAKTERVPGYFDDKFTPEYVNGKLNERNPIVSSNPQAFGESIDRWVMAEAIERGMPKTEAVKLVTEQSPYVAKLAQNQENHPEVFQNYVSPDGALSREFDHAFANYTRVTQVPEVTQEITPQVVPQPEPQTPEPTATQFPNLPELDLTALTNGKQVPQPQDEQIRAAIEPKLVGQMGKVSASEGLEPAGAIVHVNWSKAVVPIEPTAPQLEERIPALVTPPQLSDHEPLKQALDAANARIDSMQKQLDSVSASVQNLSAQVQDLSLKGWAKNTAQVTKTTAQTFAIQTKANVVQWVSTRVEQLQQKAQQLKDAALKAVGEVKFAAQVKTIEVKEAVRTKVNDLLAPVDSAALTKAADHMINKWGHAGRFEGDTFDFQRSGAGEISIFTKDGTPVFAKGAVTDLADAKVKAHLSQIPQRVERVQNLSLTPEKPTQQKNQAFSK